MLNPSSCHWLVFVASCVQLISCVQYMSLLYLYCCVCNELTSVSTLKLCSYIQFSYHIIIIIIIIISFMQGIYTYIPDTNYVPRKYNVAAILLLLFMVLISLVSVLNLLYFYISTFRCMCVQCPIWLFSVVP